MAIHVLDSHTAELIAAGEVVERPASAIKELIENSIDAGATSIAVTIQRGGTALMQIEDNGGGIAAEDIPLAFLRHATSKVRTEADLDNIQTLGFRGEALASIASVARVELLTKTEEDEYASLYRIEGGQELELLPAGRATGTTITIRDLFYNTPARMKFLKKDATEGGYITEAVTRLALGNPQIAFRYTRDGKLVFQTPGDGELASAVWSVLGGEFAKELTAIEGSLRQYSVKGLITKPHAARASRSMQFFYINGRFVKNRTMMAALEQAYRGMMMQGRFPGCVVCLDMPPQLVDVNVHPAKTEVRFAREKEVFDAVYASVKAALVEASATHLSFKLEKEPVQQAEPGETQAQQPRRADFVIPIAARPAEQKPRQAEVKQYNQMVETLASDPVYLPYKTNPITPPPEYKLDILAEAEPKRDMTLEPAKQPAQTTMQMPQEEPEQVGMEAEDAGPELRFIGEVFSTYILTEWNGTLCVIDKHAAHERLIFEQIMATRKTGDTQQLLSPVAIALSAAEKDALLSNGPVLEAAGIEVEDFGGNGVLVRGVPADIEPANVSDLVVEVAKRMAVNSRDSSTEKTEWVLHSVACRAAVKAGDKTAPGQLLRLAEDILSGKVPPFCPHGRPVVLEITRKELEKQFGRLG